MRLGGEPGLAPLEPHEGDEVRAPGVPRQGVALPHALLGGVPVLGEQGFRVVGQGEEVEIGAVAGEVAGVRRRVDALAADQGQREEEAVPRVGGVHVEVSEEDLLRRRLRGRREGGVGRPLRRGGCVHGGLGLAPAFDRSRTGLLRGAGAHHREQDPQQESPSGLSNRRTSESAAR